MNFKQMFCRDFYDDNQEYFEFTIRTVIPKNKKQLTTNWANMYKLSGVIFKEVTNGLEFEVQGDCLEGRDELFDELLKDLYSVVDGKEEIYYSMQDSKRPDFSWDGVVYPKGGHFEYSKGAVEYLL